MIVRRFPRCRTGGWREARLRRNHGAELQPKNNAAAGFEAAAAFAPNQEEKGLLVS